MKSRLMAVLLGSFLAVGVHATQLDAQNGLNAMEGRLPVVYTAINARDYKTAYSTLRDMARDHYAVSSFLYEASRGQSAQTQFRKANSRCSIILNNLNFAGTFNYLNYDGDEFVGPAEFTYFVKPLAKEIRKCRSAVDAIK